ncbi:MAG: ArnT family glycosyltransferase [Planctomycetota bacterium]
MSDGTIKGALAVIVIGLALYLPGINWGLPGQTSWSQDSIAGMRSIGAVINADEGWSGRYSPLHYYLLFAVYQPVLNGWQEAGEVIVDHDAGRVAFAANERPGSLTFVQAQAEQLATLHRAARIVAVVMAIMTLLGIFFATRAIIPDALAAFLSTLPLMLSAAFVYFAHLGNVDVPAMCWFAWSMFFFVRAAKTGSWLDAGSLGLIGSLAICTKDSLAGVYPGMALAILYLHWRRAAYEQTSETGAPTETPFLSALVRPQWWLGIVLFVVPYLLINDVFGEASTYPDRMRYWLSDSADTLHAKQYRYRTLGALLLATVIYAVGALGWPMFLAMAASLVQAWRKHRTLFLAAVLPSLSYFLIVIVRIEFVYSRFLFPVIALIGMPAGVFLAAIWRRSRLSRILLSLFLLVPTIAYAASIPYDMMLDSRYRAERWFREHVEPPSSIGAFMRVEDARLKPQYLPRLVEMGYATYPVLMSEASFSKPQPEYLVLSSYDYADYSRQELTAMKKLLSGDFGYEEVAFFTANRGPELVADTILQLSRFKDQSLRPGKISPTLHILRRSAPGTP